MNVNEDLFNTAKDLFKDLSPITAALQNPGTIKTQDQVEGLFRQVDQAMKREAEKLRLFNDRCSLFKTNLKNAYINGDLSV